MWSAVLNFANQLRKPKQESLLNAICELVSIDVLQEQIKNLHDWRLLVFELSKRLKISEFALWYEISERMALPFLEKVPLTNLLCLPTSVSVGALKKIGAIPIYKGTKLIGVACLDPKKLKGLSLKSTNIPIYLASWQAINEALDESEKIAAERIASVDIEQQKEGGLAKQILRKVVEEVVSVDSSSVTFVFESTSVNYQYLDASRVLIKKEIQGPIHNALLKLLRTIQQAGKLSDLIAGIKDPNSFSVKFLPSSLTTINLSWRGLEPSSQEQKSLPLVVVIEDSECFSKIIERHLRYQGFEAHTFFNARAAISWISSNYQSVAALICDLHMPEVSGFRVLSELKADLNLKNLPIVALTSDNEAETEIEALRLGVDAFVTKDEDPQILLLHLDRLSKRRVAA